MFTDNTILAFKIYGGGGNRRRVKCLGEYPIGHFTYDLFLDCDEEGNIVGTEYKDDSGNFVGLTVEQEKTGIGRIDIDGDYNTIYTKRCIDIDCDSTEAYAIMKDCADVEAAEFWQYITDGVTDEDRIEDFADKYGLDKDDIARYNKYPWF